MSLIVASVLSARIELGRHLFYDTRLSGNGTQSCATCHQQPRAFSDGRPTAAGSTGERHTRNTMTLTNVGRNVTLTWDDARKRSLEKQARVPLFGRKPLEMGANRRAMLATLRSDARYGALFREAYPAQRKPVTVSNALHAVAMFERALVSEHSPFDRALRGEHEAMPPAAWRGLRVFTGAGCGGCHQGDGFAAQRFANNGVTAGRFRIPTLRNVAVTAPYMHDGSIGSLDAVVDRYVVARKLSMSAQERADLLAFLHALTDEDFLVNPRFGNPWQVLPASHEVAITKQQALRGRSD
ncbi:MAG TPA: cytochrome c peroxidase [Thermoanaerobaculia bacterium]|nr:cytochrome c peroxidase [Thermoanaerobaculia bacterium]